MNWKYTVSLEISEPLESGFFFSLIVETYNAEEALNFLRDGRNRLERTGKINGKIVTELLVDNRWERQ